MQRVTARRPAALIALAVAGHLGCGGPCQRVAHARDVAMARPAPATGPHLRLRLPFAVANALIADVLAGLPPVPVTLGRLGPLATVIGDLTAVPRAVTLGPAGPGLVHVELAVELRDRDGVLLTLATAADLDPTIDRTGDEVAITIGLTPARIDRLELDLGDDIARALGGVLAARLPAAARARVPRFVIDQVAAAATEEIASGTWLLLRHTLLPRLGELTRIRIALPPIPVASIALTSTTATAAAPAELDLAIVTSLPVRAAVADPGPPLAADAIELAVSGSAIAELGNWAIASGHAPARYQRSLKPAPDGEYVPRLDWRDGHARPLLVHVDRVAGGCEWFTVGVTPTLAVRGERIVAGARTRTFERVLGPAYLHVAAWLKQLLQGAVSRKVAAAATVTVGGRQVNARLRAVDLDGAGVRAAAALTLAPP